MDFSSKVSHSLYSCSATVNWILTVIFSVTLIITVKGQLGNKSRGQRRRKRISLFMTEPLQPNANWVSAKGGVLRIVSLLQ